MDEYFGISQVSFFSIVLTTLGIYIAMIILVRISGKRSFSKMSSFDFATTIAIGSVIASGMVLKEVTLIKCVVALASIFALQSLVAYLMRYKGFLNVVDNHPLLLMNGSIILHENLDKAHITEADLRSKLRTSNVMQLSEVKAVILERTGDLTVLHSNDNSQQVEDWLLSDVMRK